MIEHEYGWLFFGLDGKVYLAEYKRIAQWDKQAEAEQSALEARKAGKK